MTAPNAAEGAAGELAAALAAAKREIASLRRQRTTLCHKLAAEERLRPWQVELLKLQRHLDAQDLRMIVVFEGRDAAGKGGAIRRVTRYMNPQHYRVVALGQPSAEERSQWYFQRYVAQFPSGGEIVLFDRSWYNRAMVEPVLGFCTPEQYQDFMLGVIGFEKDLVRQGTVIVKLYFSVTKQEQARRFARRQTDPLRQWKLSEVDLQAQDRWDDFTAAKYEMLVRTSSETVPWMIIRSNDKQQARLNTMKVVLGAIEYKGRSPDLDFAPDPGIVIAGADEIALMEAERLRNGSFAS